jgi:Cdc6-like AAA superfamily ATPase
MVERVLAPNITTILNETNERRIECIDNGFFVEYPQQKKISKMIYDLLKQPVRPRMYGLLLYAPTNSGKTYIINKFMEEYENQISGSFLYVYIPERATLKEVYAETLHEMGYPITNSRSTGDLRRKILIALHEQKKRMILFDEIQHLLDSRRDHKRDILNGLKMLNNQAQIPITLSGIETSTDILAEDTQVADRFRPVELLP